MLARQGILPNSAASVLLKAISKLDRVGILRAAYDGRFEDLFFYIQHLLTQSCGEDVAGRIHTAQSQRHRSHDVPHVHTTGDFADCGATGDDSPERLVTEMERLAPEVVGKKLGRPREVWLRALDPVHFIGIRAIPGGPAPEAVRVQIACAQKEQTEAEAWLNLKRSLIGPYPQTDSERNPSFAKSLFVIHLATRMLMALLVVIYGWISIGPS